MRLKKTYLFVFSLLFWLCNFCHIVYAQPTSGIVWDVPDDNRTAMQQLQLFEEIGISHLEIKHPVSAPLLSELETSNFSVLIRSEEKYYTLEELISKQELFQQNTNLLINEYEANARVAGLGIISQSHFKDPEFNSAFETITKEISSQTDKTLYYYQNKKWYSLESPDTHFGILLTGSEFLINDLNAFNDEFKTFIDGEEEMIIFMHSAWLIDALSTFPEFKTSLSLYNESGSWIIPLPDQKPVMADANWLVFALIILWIILAVQVKFIPNARAMIMRYFFAHRFYVDDILHYRERYATQSIIMMILHALTGGIVVYILAIQLLNDSGLNALYHHLPWLEVFGSGYYSISFLAIITLLILQAVSIFWLYLPAKNLDHVSQIANLYAGLLYTDYITLTLLISFYLTDFSTILVLVLITFYVLLGFANFYITAFNTARNIGADKIFYFLITSVLHTIVSLSVLVYILTQTEIIDILSLSTSL